mgnify:CR=1 FL=1|tara:strand:- start:2631 stop:2939 length:309 start_codon:yes stop_codon:yes gene_type:complete
MSEIGEIFAATKEQRKHESKCRKRNNMNASRIMLGKNNINYESKNGGVHIIASYQGKVADFWPSTGKFNIRGDNRYFRGVRLLIKILRGDYTEEQFKALRGE